MTSVPQDELPLTLTTPEAIPPVEFTRPLDAATRYTIVRTPIGEVLLTGDGASLTGLYMGPEEGGSPPVAPEWLHDPGVFHEAAKQLGAYFAGELREFSVPLAPRGTSFQLRAWRALTTIPYGGTATYGSIAAAIGQWKAARAIGLANNRNPISILVPCHRVVGADGSLVGYGGGLSRKERLLRLERGGRR